MVGQKDFVGVNLTKHFRPNKTIVSSELLSACSKWKWEWKLNLIPYWHRVWKRVGEDGCCWKYQVRKGFSPGIGLCSRPQSPRPPSPWTPVIGRCQKILGIQEGIMLFDQKILDCDSVGPGLGIWQTRVFCSVAARPFCADAASLKIKKFVFPNYIWLQDWEVFKNYIWFRRFSSPDEGGAVVRGRQQGRILHWICPGLVGQIL